MTLAKEAVAGSFGVVGYRLLPDLCCRRHQQHAGVPKRSCQQHAAAAAGAAAAAAAVAAVAWLEGVVEEASEPL